MFGCGGCFLWMGQYFFSFFFVFNLVWPITSPTNRLLTHILWGPNFPTTNTINFLLWLSDLVGIVIFHVAFIIIFFCSVLLRQNCFWLSLRIITFLWKIFVFLLFVWIGTIIGSIGLWVMRYLALNLHFITIFILCNTFCILFAWTGQYY